MSEQTFIKGKEKSLEESIENLHEILQEVGFDIQEGLKLNPVPGIHSLNIYEKSCPGLFTNGKGASEKATLASALGEYLERLSTNYFFSDFWLESDYAASDADWLYYPDEKSFSRDEFAELLNDVLWQYYADMSHNENYEEFSLQDFEFDSFLSFNDHVDQIRALPLKSEQTGEISYFPMNLLSNLYASNGLAAGNTPLEAKVQGLSEVFERWVKNQILLNNYCLPIVPQEVLNQFLTISKAIKALNQEGLYIEVRDASLGGKFPVINVTLYDQKSGRCFASFGAHPIFEVAIERTLTESLQGRHLKELDGFQVPSFDEFSVASDENIENHFIDSSGLIHANFVSKNFDFEFIGWDFKGDVTEQWAYLCELVYQQGTDVYSADYNQFGFDTCRLVVPGMSEVYPKHELLESNQNFGRLLREALLNYQSTSPLEMVELIDALGFSDHQGVASLIGLMPDKNSFWGNVNCLQLKFWCQLAEQDYESALDSLQGIWFFVEMDSPWFGIYKAFEFALELLCDTQNDVELIDSSGLQTLFGEENTQRVLDHLSGDLQFWHAPLGIDIFKESNSHQTMLEIYYHLRKYKLAAN